MLSREVRPQHVSCSTQEIGIALLLYSLRACRPRPVLASPPGKCIMPIVHTRRTTHAHTDPTQVRRVPKYFALFCLIKTNTGCLDAYSNINTRSTNSFAERRDDVPMEPAHCFATLPQRILLATHAPTADRQQASGRCTNIYPCTPPAPRCTSLCKQ